MRLIDADALLIHSYRVVEYDEAGFSMGYNAVPTEEIKNAPTVDAVPVVRCKDCKHSDLPAVLTLNMENQERSLATIHTAHVITGTWTKKIFVHVEK